MKLTKNDFRGTRQVFAFTLKQMMFNKANIISLIVTFLLILFMMPVMTLINGSETAFGSDDDVFYSDETQETSLPETVYVLNETPFVLDYETDLNYANVNFETSPFSADDYKYELSENEGFVHIYMQNEEFKIDCDAPAAEQIASYISYLLNSSIAESAEGIDKINAPYSLNLYTVSEYAEEDSIDLSMDSYYIQLLYSIVVMLVSLYAAAFIVQSVVQEKTSKLVEVLMISVKPLALILGKILAAMLYVFGLVATNVAAGVLSYVINKALFGGESAGSMMAEMGISLPDLTFSPLTWVIIIISLFLGYLTYSLIAGMTGAGCSKPEDMQSANSTSMMIVMACYMAALITTSIQSPVVSIVTSIVPFLSVFCAPVQFVMGNVGIGILIVSWVLQIVVIAFLAWMCAKIYEDLIIYKGNRLTFMQIMKMALTKKKKGEA